MLRRQLGFAAAAAIVAGDILGSGIFFTPGELASIAQETWHVYFFWGLCGFITLCGALTVAELTTLLPRAGASYHIIRAGFGPFWGFIKIWIETCISGPGSVAGVAIIFGEFASRLFGHAPPVWGSIAIAAFAAVNLFGVQWGGRTQIVLTVIKISALLLLVVGSMFIPSTGAGNHSPHPFQADLVGLLRFIGLGVAAVLFTYDGWTDVTHVAGEVKEPARNLPLALGLGVGFITVLYLMVNYAFVRIVPLREMGAATVATIVAERTFGPTGASFLNALISISILGALGGVVMTLPRLFFTAAAQYRTKGTFFSFLASLSKTDVPHGSIVFCAATSILALLFFQTFSRIVNFFVVPFQLINILLVASVFRLRKRASERPEYRTPGYPVVPLIFIVVMTLLVVSAVVYRPMDTFIGVALTACGIPVYVWIQKK